MRVAGYVIEEKVAVGGMAMVFRAHEEKLGRLVALKVMAQELASDVEFRARFLRESRTVSAVDSPYIIPVYAAGEADGVLYIATRFVPGGDLGKALRLAGGVLSADRALDLVAQVAAALDAAHAAGLVHRDVKPGNVLIDAVPGRTEHAYLSDFGLSKRIKSASGLTAAGHFLGTPDYCAPEQISGRDVDGRADQYSLACVAFTLLTGTPPFHRDEPVPMLFAHLNDPVPRRPRSGRRCLPRWTRYSRAGWRRGRTTGTARAASSPQYYWTRRRPLPHRHPRPRHPGSLNPSRRQPPVCQTVNPQRYRHRGDLTSSRRPWCFRHRSRNRHP